MSETITSRLGRIQKALKAPKEENKFVNYKSRSAEQILEAAKDVLKDGEFVTCSDDIIAVGTRVYVKATATFGFGADVLSVTGWAREPEDAPLSNQGKPMMQQPQLTGSSSSYARKYALGGLFAIDDSRDDPDRQATHTPDTSTERTTDKPEPNTGITEAHKKFQRDCLYDILVAQNDADLDQLIEQNTHAFGELPDIINGQITDTISSRRKQIAGNIHPKPEWGFINVGEAAEFAIKAGSLVDDPKLEDGDLQEWFHENSHKIAALDKTLKAEKYKKEGKTTGERLNARYKERINK